MISKKAAAAAVVLCVSTAVSASADGISVLVNGTRLEMSAEPFIENERTLVPMRAIFEALGAYIVWDADLYTVHAYGANGEYIAVQINNPTAYVNNEGIALDTPAVIRNDLTYVPLRFVAEALGAEVSWDEAEQTVRIEAGGQL